LFVFSSRRRHTRFSRDWSSDVCSSDLEIAAFDGILLVHAEDAATIAAAPAASGRRYADYLRSRPPVAETRAIEMLVRLARETGRSEERRVGKECRTLGWRYDAKK